ncbi:hypothetical protein MY5147_006401 [Beauveria neobassiana]
MHLNTATFPALIRQGVDAHDRCPKPLASAQHLPASMDGLSVAASVIAVVDVSVKVITLCSQYSKAVANASADISRLETLLKGLKTTLDHAEALIKAPQGASLSTSQNLQEQLTACHSTLQKLHDKLDGGIARQTKHRLWTRALKWPFSRDEIDSMVSTLEHCHRRIMDGLLIDQTKSQIAIEIAYNVHDSSPEKSVFWIHGASRATLEQSYRSLADNLALPRRHDPKTNILALVCDWLQRDDVAPWLLILDNADNFDTFFSQTEEIPIASYLPKSNNGKTLITSRNLDVAERLTGGHKAIISIPAMKSDEALLLLQEKLTSSYNTATATDLIRYLDYIPLAVNQAAAYINRRQREQRTEDDENDDETLEKDLDVLFAYSLVRASAEPDLYEMHSLVQISLDVARQSAEIREELLGPNHYHTLNSLDRLAFTYGCQGRWVEAEKLQVRVMETSKTKLGADHLDTLRRARNMAITFWRQGRLEEAERLEVQLLEKFKTKLGTDHPDTLTSMSDIATTYFTQGRFEEAERLQVQLLEKMKTRLGADHPNTLTSMSDIAKTYFTQGRLEEAERLQVQLLEKFKTKLGAEHPDTLTSMSYLALIYWHQGRLKEAETLEVQVLGGRKAKLGANHPDTLIIMHNLALTLESLGRLHEALELMHSCVCLRQHILGQSHPDTKSSERAMAMWQQGTE